MAIRASKNFTIRKEQLNHLNWVWEEGILLLHQNKVKKTTKKEKCYAPFKVFYLLLPVIELNTWRNRVCWIKHEFHKIHTIEIHGNEKF